MTRLCLGVAIVVWACLAVPARARAQEPPGLGTVELHGFVSEGGFISTDNEYIGRSSRGSVELFEAGINFSTEITDDLHAGLQLFSRNVGDLDDLSPRVDWAFLDYRWRSWLGLRAGIIKMPFGLYNEYADIDTARLAILMPQSVYPIRNRDVLLSHSGFAVYGDVELDGAGELAYQAWLGTLQIPRNALTLIGASLDFVDTRYVTGAQVFWTPPIEGLRIGGTWLRASIDFHLTLDPDTVEQLIAAGLVPADYDGKLVVSQRPDTLLVASIEYTHEDWLFAAEYGRSLKHQQTSLPDLIPAFDEDTEGFYGMATYRFTDALEAGVYVSLLHPDVNHRDGDSPAFAEKFHGFQRDAAATARYDVNEHWLWKAEAHVIDGTADLPEEKISSPPVRRWALFLIKTTVTF